MNMLLDEADRRRAVRERERNLIVEASAGTGKTKLIVDRLVELVAPTDGRDPISIDRLAAITFTRKAAGELRVRARQRLLETLATIKSDAPRAAPLLRALGGIDTAHIETIHGFAQRLLRKWPAQARLDPLYELDEDASRLTEECLQLLVRAAEDRTLRELLRGSPVEERAEEAMETILDAQRAGLRLRSLETEHWTYHGLDGLVGGYIVRRDVELADPKPIGFDRAAFERHAEEYLDLVEGLSSDTSGGKWLLGTGQVLRRVRGEADATAIYREVVDRFERGPRGRASDAPSKRHDFAGDDRAWDVWNALEGDDRREPVRAGSLRDDLLSPLRRWLAVRLVRLRPVVLQVYEIVKSRHQAVDHVDLLLRLRNLLRDDRAIRRSCQGLFDHIFVDEFQDTDPLQAEIVLFLCECGAEAATWDAVKLAPGTLTVVGDPKQSIYRFRGADIGTYKGTLDIIARSPHLTVRLSSSFRSAPGLVDWLNARFAGILGNSDPGELLRRKTGEVPYQALTRGRTSGADPTVHAVAMESPEGGDVAEYRALEATTTARYLRWLVETSALTVIDPISDEARAIRYGDVGVLAVATTNLPVLFEALDCDGVPYASRGGTLFLADPLHRRFLLGLCALSDRDDGVAFAALLRPPFFAVDLGDLARSRAGDPDDRVMQARAMVQELRRRRFGRSPGATARALLEETGIGRSVSLGPNGVQRLAGLRELCFQLEKRALKEHLDFDAVVERLRVWIDHPQGLDRPHPVGSDTIRVMTVHQAKGLEFPVVVLWDGRAAWTERQSYDAWTVERDGGGWALRLDTLKWEESADLEIVARERRMREAERKRLVYVAATRARDILVVPKVGAPDDRWLLGRLLGSASSPSVVERPLHTPEVHAPWFDAAAPGARPLPRETTTLDVELLRLWQARAQEASRDRMPPVAFTKPSSPRAMWDQQGRFGAVFGETVHIAIGLALRTRCSADQAVQQAAGRTRLADHLGDAVDDVSRALAELDRLGISASACQLEYAIAGLSANGQLVAGCADLVARTADGVTLLDFKTDAPPANSQVVAPRYIDQVVGYAAVLASALATPIRAGLLFTADGGVRWLSSCDNGRS
jgi:ATP-dependent helicase/nuclease subunit A